MAGDKGARPGAPPGAASASTSASTVGTSRVDEDEILPFDICESDEEGVEQEEVQVVEGGGTDAGAEGADAQPPDQIVDNMLEDEGEYVSPSRRAFFYNAGP